MRKLKRTLALTLLLGAGATQAATVCSPGPSYWDVDCFYQTPNGVGPTNPTDPTDPTDPTNPTDPTGPKLPNSPPNLDPGTGGGLFGGGFASGEPFFFVAAPAKDFPGFVPSSNPPSEIPLPPSAWLLGTALFGLISIARRRRRDVYVVDLPQET